MAAESGATFMLSAARSTISLRATCLRKYGMAVSGAVMSCWRMFACGGMALSHCTRRAALSSPPFHVTSDVLSSRWASMSSAIVFTILAAPVFTCTSAFFSRPARKRLSAFCTATCPYAFAKSADASSYVRRLTMW